MNTKINIEQICKIKIYEKLKHERYVYRDSVKILFWEYRKAGFYLLKYIGSDQFVTNSEIYKNPHLFCEGKSVYYAPHIEIYLSNQHMNIKWFGCVEELNEYVNKLPFTYLTV